MLGRAAALTLRPRNIKTRTQHECAPKRRRSRTTTSCATRRTGRTSASSRDQTVAGRARASKRRPGGPGPARPHSCPEVNFDGVALHRRHRLPPRRHGANIFVNWKASKAAGIDKNAPVTARLRNVKFSKALNIDPRQTSAAARSSSATPIDEGVITISTAEDLGQERRHPRLRHPRPDHQRPRLHRRPRLQPRRQQTNQRRRRWRRRWRWRRRRWRRRRRRRSAAASSAAAAAEPNGRSRPTTRQELVDDIIKLIEDTVATESLERQRRHGRLAPRASGQLIVTQTPENQRQLVNLLEQLRETRAIQVTIETRFLTVQRNFLEDIGVDLDFFFNINSSCPRSSARSPITSATAARRFTHARPVDRRARHRSARQHRADRAHDLRPPSSTTSRSTCCCGPRRPASTQHDRHRPARHAVQRPAGLRARRHPAGLRQRPRRRSSAPASLASTRPSALVQPACCSTCRRPSRPTASTSR